MARRPSKESDTRRRAVRAARLPSGSYSWRGRAVPFSRLPKAERSRFRSLWAGKAADTRSKERAIEKRAPNGASAKDRKQARDWVGRRTVKVEQQIEHSRRKGRKGLPSAAPAKEVLAKLGPSAILAARELQRAAHRAYKGKPGGRARAIAEQIREALGKDLANAMPQLWWYH